MKIEYKDADGRVMELDVSDEIGQFYLSSVEEAEKSDRRNTRPDRHTSLETFVYAHGNTRHPFRLPERDAVHHIVFRPEACLCEAEDWREPVRRGVRHLHGRGRHEEMGAAGKLRSQVRGKHCASGESGYFMLCYADASELLHCGYGA